MLCNGASNIFMSDFRTLRFSLRHVAAKLCSTAKTAMPISDMNLRRILRCGMIQSRTSSSALLFVGGMPGYLRNVKRLSAALASVPANARLPYPAANTFTSLASILHVSVSAPPYGAVFLAILLALRNMFFRRYGTGLYNSDCPCVSCRPLRLHTVCGTSIAVLY